MWTIAPAVGLWLPAGTVHSGFTPAGTWQRSAQFSPSRTAPLASGPVAVDLSALLRLLLDRLITKQMDERSRTQTEEMILDVMEPSDHPLLLPIPESALLAPIVDALGEDPADSTSLESWAERLGVSARTLTRAFEAETGMTFRVWTATARTQRAVTLMTSGAAIDEVADAVGYRSASAFTTAFRRVTGLTPGQFRRAGSASAAALAAVLSACSGTSDDSASASGASDTGSGGSASGATTFEHVFGTTEIPASPERITTVAWANHEVPLALGVVPAGMAAANFGDEDGDGLLPWVADALEELGAETPVLFDESDGIDFEAAAAHPAIAGRNVMFLTHVDTTDLSQVSFYTAHDTRTQFFEDLGMAIAPSVVAASEETEEFSATVSAEQADAFDDVEIIVTYGDESLIAAL